MLKPAILSVSLLTIMASAAVSPALNEIKNAFPGVMQTDVKLVLTLPALIMIPFSLLSGWFATKFSKKTILYIGLIIYLICGIGGGFAQTFTQLLVIRGFLGVAIGLLMPLSSSLIFDFFEGPARNKMMGLAGSTNQLGGMIFLSVAGILASYSWRYTFGVYLLAVVTIIFITFWLPSESKPKEEKNTKNKEKIKLTPGIFGIGFIAMMTMIVFFVVSTDLALFVENERPVFSSTATLFNSSEELQTSLKTGEISPYTIAQFNNKGIKLSEQTKFSEIEKGKSWKFTDHEKEYTIRKANNELVVYTGIGTSRIAGYALSLMGLPAVLAGFILAFMLAKMKNFLMPFAASIMALGYYLLSISDSTGFIYVSVIFIGFAGGLLSPPLMLMIPKVVAPNARTLGIAIVSSLLLFGQFLSPICMRWISVIFNNDTFRFRFQFLAIFIIISAVIALVGMIINNNIQSKKITQSIN